MPDTVFSYCLAIGSREFLIEVTRDGFIHWDDYQQRRRLRNPDERHLELDAFLGSARARKRLSAEIDEFTVSFQLSPELFARFSEAARLLADERWTAEHEQELDQFLIPLFWSEVNPHLNDPLPGGVTSPSEFPPAPSPRANARTPSARAGP